MRGPVPGARGDIRADRHRAANLPAGNPSRRTVFRNVMTEPRFAIVPTALGAFGAVWSEAGIVRTWMHDRTPEATRRQIARAFPERRRSVPPRPLPRRWPTSRRCSPASAERSTPTWTCGHSRVRPAGLRGGADDPARRHHHLRRDREGARRGADAGARRRPRARPQPVRADRAVPPRRRRRRTAGRVLGAGRGRAPSAGSWSWRARRSSRRRSSRACSIRPPTRGPEGTRSGREK